MQEALSGAGSSLTIELTLGGALMAAIVGAIVWVVMHGRSSSSSKPPDKERE